MATDILKLTSNAAPPGRVGRVSRESVYPVKKDKILIDLDILKPNSADFEHIKTVGDFMNELNTLITKFFSFLTLVNWSINDYSLSDHTYENFKTSRDEIQQSNWVNAKILDNFFKNTIFSSNDSNLPTWGLPLNIRSDSDSVNVAQNEDINLEETTLETLTFY